MEEKKKMDDKKKTFSITFGDVAENHAGMQKVGSMADRGFNLEELQQMKSWFDATGSCETRMVHLNDMLPTGTTSLEPAYLLIIKGGVNAILNDEKGADKLFSEQDVLEKDTKCLMYGRVVNKHARHNLCFGEVDQDPNYEAGRGRIFAFDKVPLLQKIRVELGNIAGAVASNLQAEGNYYYDVTKCGIGYHGDAERKKVIAIRLGATMPLCYVWYHRNESISEIAQFEFGHGDMYVMSEKTTGYDWKLSSRLTLRHAAGADKYITIGEKKGKKTKKVEEPQAESKSNKKPKVATSTTI